MFGLGKNKSKYVELEERIRALEKDSERKTNQIKELGSSIERMKRIAERYVPGKITYKTEWMALCGFQVYASNAAYNTYLYKDGCEYCITGLHLHNPKFSVGKLENLLYVNDEMKIYASGESEKVVQMKYLVDLSDCDFKQIE